MYTSRYKILKTIACHGQVRKIGEDRLPKKVFRWNRPGRKKKGKPKKCWLYEV